MASEKKGVISLLAGIIGQGGGFIRTAWLIIGCTLVFLLLCNAACALYYKLALKVPDSYSFSLTDSYRNAPWVREYDKELFGSDDTSWKSYVYWRKKPFQGKYIHIDRQGIRLTSPSPLKDDAARKKLKIFMFGGSTMWGVGVRDRYTIPSLVSLDLAAYGIKGEITNFGEFGYVSTQELITLALQLERGNIPDLVVFYDGFNDVFAAIQKGVAGTPHNESNREREYNLTSHYNALRKVFLEKTVDRFSLGRALKTLAGGFHPPQPAPPLPAGLANQVFHIYANNIKMIQAMGQAYGFTCLFYWQPVLYAKKDLTPFEEKYRDKRLGDLYNKTYALLKADKSELNRYHFYDISNLFYDTKTPVYLDYCHLNEEAHKVVARDMARDIARVAGLAPGP